MSLILSLIMNAATAVTTPATTGAAVPPAAGAAAEAKASDCDGSDKAKDKTIQALAAPAQGDAGKASEEKALAGLGLKKEEPKAKAVDPLVKAPTMETCK